MKVVFKNYLLRFIYGKSIFRLVTIITLVAVILIGITKIQLFKVENKSPRKITDFENSILKISNQNENPKIINFKYIPIRNSSTSIVISSKKTTVSIPQKSEEIFFGGKSIKFNSSLVVINDNLIKFVSNDILIKDMNENSKKLDKSLKSKPFDYDKNGRFCVCSKISQPCVCCVKLAEEVIGLTNSLCSNITYIPKSKAARISMKYGKLNKSDKYVLVDINNPPPVCLSQSLKFDLKSHELLKQKSNGDVNVEQTLNYCVDLEICFQARNLTYNVNVDASHKTEFKGCSNFYVMLNNMTIRIYPLGCFKASYESKDLQIQKMANGIQ